jgi:hypothetical protein
MLPHPLLTPSKFTPHTTSKHKLINKPKMNYLGKPYIYMFFTTRTNCWGKTCFSKHLLQTQCDISYLTIFLALSRNGVNQMCHFHLHPMTFSNKNKWQVLNLSRNCYHAHRIFSPSCRQWCSNWVV